MLFLALPAATALADSARFTIIEENDGLLPDGWDRHYTQGAMLSYLSPKLLPGNAVLPLFELLATPFPIFQPEVDASRKFDIVAGQSLFTPVKWHRANPDPADRPFAGWLYTGGSLFQETDGHMLENVELLVGVVGPSALGRETVDAFHSLIGSSTQTSGWKHQLRDEPGVALSYERKWRYGMGSAFGLQADFVPEAGVTLGNVLIDGEAGAQVRVGHNLAVDYGIPRIRPGLSGTSWFDADRLTDPFGWYLFAGIDGRAVAHNIFLDGNTIANSPSVHKNVLVGDFVAGASVFYADWIKVDASYTERTKEFTTQRQWDHFGNVNVSFRF